MPIIFQLSMLLLMPRPTTPRPSIPAGMLGHVTRAQEQIILRCQYLEPLVHLLRFFFLQIDRNSLVHVRFLFYLRHPFSSHPPPPASSSSSRRPRRRASYCRRRRAAHPQHDSASWPPRLSSGGCFSLNPAARHPPRRLCQHAGLCPPRGFQTPRSSILSTSLRGRKFGPAPSSSLRCSG